MSDINGIKTAIRTCMLNRANVSVLCDTLSDLQQFGYIRTFLPTPIYAQAPINIISTGNILNIRFVGNSEVRRLVYDADFQSDSSGNARFIKTSRDTLGEHYLGDSR